MASLKLCQNFTAAAFEMGELGEGTSPALPEAEATQLAEQLAGFPLGAAMRALPAKGHSNGPES